VIRIQPRRIVSWGVDPDLRSMTARSVSSVA
jgi:hypothetical protein